MECRKLVFALVEWLGMEEVGFVPTGIALTGANRFWANLTGLEWRKSVLACLEWPGKQLVSFGPTVIAWKFRKRQEERNIRRKSKFDIKLTKKKVKNYVKHYHKVVKKLENCQKVVKKLLKSCQKVENG
jgi:hypothetical protein